VNWASLIHDGQQPPAYEPPADFLAATGQHWPPPAIRWPVPEVVATETLGTTGPTLPPVN
jgi:aminobenzoyl-glutamate utilization protein B